MVRPKSEIATSNMTNDLISLISDLAKNDLTVMKMIKIILGIIVLVTLYVFYIKIIRLEYLKWKAGKKEGEKSKLDGNLLKLIQEMLDLVAFGCAGDETTETTLEIKKTEERIKELELEIKHIQKEIQFCEKVSFLKIFR